jgi:hypothetical protein
LCISVQKPYQVSLIRACPYSYHAPIEILIQQFPDASTTNPGIGLPATLRSAS